MLQAQLTTTHLASILEFPQLHAIHKLIGDVPGVAFLSELSVFLVQHGDLLVQTQQLYGGNRE